MYTIKYNKKILNNNILLQHHFVINLYKNNIMRIKILVMTNSNVIYILVKGGKIIMKLI